MAETEDLVDRVQAAYDEVLAHAGDGFGRLGDFAREKPWSALGLALALGLLVGHAKGRSGRSVLSVAPPRRR
jgi:ElaB/YqjD/DUF883 family membrane-anchored ribosome-binding protein